MERHRAGTDQPRVGRLDRLDAQPINLDGFAQEDVEAGLLALRSPFDPEPSLVIADGEVTELDGRPRAEFDVIDEFIARHGLDLSVAPDAMALAEVEFARMIVDTTTPRSEVARLAGGMTPAKLARVVAMLTPPELQIAMAKMRVRRTPSIQAHVTNQMDDPLLLAADAATAVAFGFRELETTVPVLGDAASNALALLIGSQVGAAGALVQCSIEEALELELGLRGLTNYAETVSIYGTEAVFVDGDDTPWSKDFLSAAYASRGVKMRVTSGAGSEVLMGAAERRSMLYLESRCVSLARAMGVQGVQNGGIDGASVASSVPEGMKELVAENLMVMLRDLESCSGNDTLISESDIRRTAHMMPVFLAGSDFIFSGYGSIPRYDNTFAISNFNAEDLDDYLVLQRDWGIDGGLRPCDAATLAAVRERAAQAVRAVYQDLGLAEFDEERVGQVVAAEGSRDLDHLDGRLVLDAAERSWLTGSPCRRGRVAVADRIHGGGRAAHALTRERLKGDYLQPAAIFDESMRVLSKHTDPNDYRGPGTGYEPSTERRAQINGIRQARSIEDLLHEQAESAGNVQLRPLGPSARGQDLHEVCIGVSPAFAESIWVALSGLDVGEVLDAICDGLAEEACPVRVIRVAHTIDVGLIGLTAARLAGSGVGIGLQGKGTAVIHQRDLTALANLELYSVAPLVTRQMYRALGINAARHAKGLRPVPVFKGGTEEAITARYHASTVALVTLERAMVRPGSAPIDLEIVT